MITESLEYLLSTQTSQGGWGYYRGHAPGVEPTCAVILAALQESHDTAFQKAADWLFSIQHEDGGWGINEHDTSSCWQTAWAVWALQAAGYQELPIQQGINWLLEEDVMAISDLDELEAGRSIAGIDFSLRGWPWQPGEASWVEPTALALLALESVGNRGERILEAVSYLENRRCPGGGWNVGNPVMFTAILPVRANPTAWSIMALSKIAPNAIMQNDITALQAEMIKDGGAMALAWGCLALKSNGQEIPTIILDSLAGKQSSDGAWENNPYITAVARMSFQDRLWI